jgi:hypothetical protein
MTISRGIIDDLYPLYAAGEASPDSRALIEEYLAEHPGAAAALKGMVSLPPVEPPPDLEVRALKRTTWLLQRGNTIGAAALTVSLAPTAISYIGQGKLHILYQDLPRGSVLIYLGAILLWAGFFFACRRAQVAGLVPRRTWPTRVVWMLIGSIVGWAACAPFQYWTGWRYTVNVVPWVTFSIALLMGEWLGQIPKVGDLTPPITIFGPHDDDGAN